MPKKREFRDYIGKTINYLTVQDIFYEDDRSYFKCKCVCGKETIKRADFVVYGRTTSCGCKRYEKENIIGRTFGNLTVIKKCDKGLANGTRLYECQCSCGNIVKTTASKLLTGKITECDNIEHQIKEYQGKKFGMLTIIGDMYRKDNRTYCLCGCDCGNEVTVRLDDLKSGKVVSCGCKKKENRDKGREVLAETFVEGTNISQISPNRKLNSNNKTGVKGVSWSKDKMRYHAQITFKRKVYHLGYFDNLEEAKQARLKAEDEFFQAFLDENNIKTESNK